MSPTAEERLARIREVSDRALHSSATASFVATPERSTSSLSAIC